MNIKKLEKILEKNKQPKFRLDQILKAVYNDGVFDFSQILNLPKNLRQVLNEEIKILSFSKKKISVSVNGDSVKALLELADGNFIETVIISTHPGLWSACLSCQIGCPMNCAFCATGSGGFKRNLTAEEISDQVLFWKQWIRENYSGKKITIQNPTPGHPAYQEEANRISNIVYMGMGEPFLNWEEVKKSLKILMDKKYFNIGSRSISISTIGIRGFVSKLLSDFPQVNLAISLHFSREAQRRNFMPASNNFNLKDLRKSLDKYFERSKRKVFLEYILLYALNDSEKDMRDLVKFIKYSKNPHLLHVNLIRYNETSEEFKHSPYYRVERCKNYLLQNGINVTVRKSLGSDIQGACGQLAGSQRKNCCKK